MRHEVNADSSLIVLVKAVVDEPMDDGGLAHRLISEENYLILEFSYSTVL